MGNFAVNIKIISIAVLKINQKIVDQILFEESEYKMINSGEKCLSISNRVKQLVDDIELSKDKVLK